MHYINPLSLGYGLVIDDPRLGTYIARENGKQIACGNVMLDAIAFSAREWYHVMWAVRRCYGISCFGYYAGRQRISQKLGERICDLVVRLRSLPTIALSSLPDTIKDFIITNWYQDVVTNWIKDK